MQGECTYSLSSKAEIKSHVKSNWGPPALDFLELTLRRKLLKIITLSNSNDNNERGVIQMTFRRRFFQKLNLTKDRRGYKINKRRTKDHPILRTEKGGQSQTLLGQR